MGRTGQIASGAVPSSSSHASAGVKKLSSKNKGQTSSLKRRARMERSHTGDQGIMGGDIRKGPLVRLLQMVHGGNASEEVREIIRREIAVKLMRVLVSTMAITAFRRKKTITSEMVRSAASYHGVKILMDA